MNQIGTSGNSSSDHMEQSKLHINILSNQQNFYQCWNLISENPELMLNYNSVHEINQNLNENYRFDPKTEKISR